MVLSGRSSKTTTQRKLRFSPQQPTAPPSLGLAGADVCSLLTWCLPVLSFHFGKVDATPGRLSICAFLHGRAATSQPWTSREILALIPASLWPFGPIPGQCSHGPLPPYLLWSRQLSCSSPVHCSVLHSTCGHRFSFTLDSPVLPGAGGSLPMSHQCLPRFLEGSMWLPCDLAPRRSR